MNRKARRGDSKDHTELEQFPSGRARPSAFRIHTGVDLAARGHAHPKSKHGSPGAGVASRQADFDGTRAYIYIHSRVAHATPSCAFVSCPRARGREVYARLAAQVACVLTPPYAATRLS